MKKRHLLIFVIVLQTIVSTGAYCESDKKQSALNLVEQKCTNCHDISGSQNLHKIKKDPKTVVKEMQKKKCAGISDEQAADIARFMKAPYWQRPFIRSKCIRCHPSNFIFVKCAQDPFLGVTSKEKIELMLKRGADITDKQVDEAYNLLQW